MDSDRYRERLEHERSRVVGLIGELRTEVGSEPENEQAGELSAYDQHPADAGTDTFERERDIGILDQLERELAEIEAALERIDAGTYGIDETTGEPIAEERLEAIPTARTNIETADR